MPQGANPIQSLRRQLAITSYLRIAMMAVLIGSTLFFIRTETNPYMSGVRLLLLWTGALGLVVSGAGVPFITRGNKKVLWSIAILQMIQDGLLATVIVGATGGTGSAFTFFYSLGIINASISLGRRGTLGSAVLSAALLALLGLLEIRALKPPDLVAAVLPLSGKGSVLSALGTNVVGFAAIGYLAQFLAEQLRRSEVQQRRFRLTLEDLRQLHQSILASLGTGVVTCRLDDRVVQMNRMAEVLLGRSAGADTGRELGEVFPEAVEHLRRGEFLFECQKTTSEGKEVHLLARVTPLVSSQGEAIGRILTIEDVTHLKRMEDEVKAKEQLATIGRMAAVVAHEIRNPLAAMSASAQMLGRNAHLSDHEKRALDIIVRESERLSLWIAELLDFARPARAATQEVDVTALVAEVVEIARSLPEAARVTFTVNVEDGLSARGDPQSLHRMLVNLVKNAVEAVSESGGSVRVAAWHENGRTGRRVTLAVADNGLGLGPEQLDKVFDAFYTNKARGTGLGLASVKRIVEEHGGSVEVSSIPHIATEFRVHLPVRS